MAVTYSGAVTFNVSFPYTSDVPTPFASARISENGATQLVGVTFDAPSKANKTANIYAVFRPTTGSLSSSLTNVTITDWSSPVDASSTLVIVGLTQASQPTSTNGSANSSATSATISGPISSLMSSSLATSPNPGSVGGTPVSSSSPASTVISQGYSKGALAGTAVALFIAGVVISGLLAFLLGRRHARSRKEISNPEKASSISAARNAPTFAQPNTTKMMAQSDSDKSVASIANRSLDEIELFVEEFCAAKPAQRPSPRSAAAYSNFETPYLPSKLEDLLGTTDRPGVLIKHAIAFFLLQKIDASRNDTQSLLPRAFAVPRSSDPSLQGNTRAISQSRMLICQSYESPEQDRQYLKQRSQVVEHTSRQIELVFQPWLRGDASQRMSALKGVITHVAELGVKIFSQPAVFEWRWGQTSSRKVATSGPHLESEIIMLPGLDKLTDKDAEMLGTPIHLVEPRRESYRR